MRVLPANSHPRHTQKRGPMNRMRFRATALSLALLLTGGVALAQEITGRVTGRVTDRETGAAMGGVTVIVQGPQGEDATLTNDKGEYNFTTLPIGTYTIRFYAANTAVQVEQPGVQVSAEKTVRVNAKVAGAAQQAAQQTYVINGKAPVVDVGSARIGATFESDYTTNVPLGRTYGDVVERAPGAFIDGSGNISIGGATGLENQFNINGMNVTGLRYGMLEMGLASRNGGTNLPPEFLSQIDVNSGGYQAEYGGAMGGVVNTVLKSGTNEWHGTAFGYWSPYWMATDPKLVLPRSSALGGVRKPDFDDSVGVEVGGPLIKDKLFLWVGFAPRITDTHILRETFAMQGDSAGMPVLDASGNPVLKQLPYTARMDETHRTYYAAATVDWLPLPDNRLTLAALTTPNFNTELKNQYGIDAFSSDPRTAMESMTRDNTDVTAHWVSKLFDRRWQIDALAGMHYEYAYDRGAYDSLNNLNQLQIANTDLWTVERAPGCQPDPTTGFVPCPIAPYYYAGGFGSTEKSSAFRWSGELKSTNLFEAGGRHELKYGWHLDLNTMDLTRSQTGPDGQRAFISLPGDGTYSAQTFFMLPPTESPLSYTTGPGSVPLGSAPYYVDSLHSNVKSLSNAFFLQDSFSPDHLRNLTINAGVRLELQKLYDNNGNGVFSTDNWAPRLSAVYDPFDDGRSKISVSYGRYYESVPLDVAARYFSGENFVTNYGSLSSCQGNLSNQNNWVGAGEYSKCMANQGAPTFNTEYAQANMQGQYHNEVVATVERQVMEDMTVRLDYQHRWIGNVIEDGYGTSGSAIANPGNVPQSALDAAQQEVDAAMKAAVADPTNAVKQATYQTAQANQTALKQLASAPKPERTYDALTLSLNKRFSKKWMAHASYTYSRLIGNYEGLYQYETNYISPNGTNAYDYPELYYNNRGPLPNDRPHLFHLDGYYTQPVRNGKFVFGLAFTARSGQPRNYMVNLLPGSPYQLTFLLPRGDAGRTPTVTQVDAKIAYSHPMRHKMNLEAFIDLFNILNQQTTLQTDDNYTFQAAPPIVNGTTQDLKYAKDVTGAPLTKNPNFGQPIAYQLPFNARLGLRLTF